MKKFLITNNATPNARYFIKRDHGSSYQIEESFTYDKKELKEFCDDLDQFTPTALTFKFLQSKFKILSYIDRKKIIVLDPQIYDELFKWEFQISFDGELKDFIFLQIKMKKDGEVFSMRGIELHKVFFGYEQLEKWLETNGGTINWSEKNDSTFSQ